MKNYELSDASIRNVVLFGVGLSVLIAAVLLLVGGVFRFLAGLKEPGPAPSPLALEREIPPEPRLQVTPGVDIEKMHVAEQATLHSYGWADRQAGVVRIPIERAIELTAQRGLPFRVQAPGRK